MTDAEILKLIKSVKAVPLPERWAKDEDDNPNYMGGFLTATKHFEGIKDKIDEALHQIHEGKEGNAIQILNHLFYRL